MKYIIILSTILFALSCANKKRVFQNAEIDNSKLELYFLIPDRGLIDSSIPETDLIGGFMIEDNEIVKEIMNTWEFPILEKEKPTIPLYYLEISKNNVFYISRWINRDLTTIMGEHLHKFDKEAILKYKKHFKPIIAYKLKINRLSEARKFISALIDNSIYIPFHREGMLYQWEEYSGKIVLECNIDKLPNFENSKMKDDYLKTEFPGIGKAEIYLWDKYTSDKTATFEIISELDFSNKISDDYTIKTKWTELTDLEIIVFNKPESDLLQLANEKGVETLKIEKIDY